MDVALRDSFDTPSLDKSVWSDKYPWDARIHNYDGYAAPENVYIEDNSLIIEAQDKPQKNKRFSTGVVSTRDKFGPGHFQAAIKTPPRLSGFWPALWLAPGDVWPPEIDIFETFGDDDAPTATYHYVDESGQRRETSEMFSENRFSTDYRIYGLSWQSNRIVWYLDGTEQFRYEGDFVTDDKMYLIFNFGIGAEFLDSPDPDTLPATLEMDWIRIWQQ